jgi:hypothetical protein
MARVAGPRRGVRALGNRHGRCRCPARDQSLRRTKRQAGEGRDDDSARRIPVAGHAAPDTAGSVDRKSDALLTLLRPGDYFALLAYVGPSPDLAGELARFRNAVRDRTHAATMFGVGPRYLHSTGQLHKGGPNSGVFVLMTAATQTDLEIPGYPFTFGTLELAQALGDFASLDVTGRRALHVHLPSADARLIRQVADALLQQIALQ